MHLADHVGAGEDQVLVAALVLGAAEVPGGEVATLEVRPRRAVEDDDALGEKGAQAIAAGGGAHEGAMITGRPRAGNLRAARYEACAGEERSDAVSSAAFISATPMPRSSSFPRS